MHLSCVVSHIDVKNNPKMLAFINLINKTLKIHIISVTVHIFYFLGAIHAPDYL